MKKTWGMLHLLTLTGRQRRDVNKVRILTATSQYGNRRVRSFVHPEFVGKMTIQSSDMDSAAKASNDEIHIIPAAISDTKSLINVHKAAFANDNATQLMFRDEDDYTAQLQNMLDSQFSNPQCLIIKAVKKSTGEVVGWLGARRAGYGPCARDENGSNKDKGKGLATTEHTSLRTTLKEQFAQRRELWLSGKKYIHMETLVVHPMQQRNGIGSTLLWHLMMRANFEGAPCWMESTPAALDLYHCAGFRHVGHLKIDLAEYAPGGKYGKRGWGDYEFWYMLRLPDATVHESLSAGSGDGNRVDEKLLEESTSTS